MTSRRSASNRLGALLPVVMIAMVIIGLIAGSAVFLGRQDGRSARMAQLQAAAIGAADYAHATALTELPSAARGLTVGGSLVRRLAGEGRNVDARVRLTRLGETLFALVSEGSAYAPNGLSARRRASLILRLDVPELGFPAALAVGTTPDSLAASVDGRDRSPPGWACPPESSDVPPLVVGAPPPDWRTDSAAAGGGPLAALRSRATIRLPAGTALSSVGPVVAEGECLDGVRQNWGDPSRTGPCGSHFPVVHGEGDLEVSSGAGQGVLLVDGDLTVSGAFQFVGAVIVRGALVVSGSDVAIVGGVRAGSVRAAAGGPYGASFARSSCALRVALLSSAPLVPVAERPWAALR